MQRVGQRVVDRFDLRVIDKIFVGAEYPFHVVPVGKVLCPVPVAGATATSRTPVSLVGSMMDVGLTRDAPRMPMRSGALFPFICGVLSGF
ncbi:hypothetical protein [Arthrobacter sp. efr-133-TYG-120]|uniref:hypothetical protein n=1 Tax=Arthrobacter sp. efr-133-TYG-120 TaxID=3040280 RepID=UPI00254E7594|nr:hypothetical protein [Arthrobacter sp. efr-133-TYG-120]